MDDWKTSLFLSFWGQKACFQGPILDLSFRDSLHLDGQLLGSDRWHVLQFFCVRPHVNLRKNLEILNSRIDAVEDEGFLSKKEILRSQTKTIYLKKVPWNC